MGFKLPGFLTGSSTEETKQPKQLSVETDEWKKKEKERIKIAQDRLNERQVAGEASLEGYVGGVEGFAGGFDPEKIAKRDEEKADELRELIKDTSAQKTY